jgi:hypothetical protein
VSIKLLKNVNFGRNQGGLGNVGFTLIDGDGTVSAARSTAGVHEVGTSTGIYGAQITFTTEFSGSILWDTGTASPRYATEDYNPTDERLKFNFDIAGGRWRIVGDQMIFYRSDNTTEVTRFDLFDDVGAPSSDAVFERVKV